MSGIVDVHAHALDAAFLEGLAESPGHDLAAGRDGQGGYALLRGGGPPGSLDPLLHDLPRRLASLRERQVGLQVVGPPPPVLTWPGGAADAELARALNHHTAALVERGEGRIEGMAALALGEPERAADELQRAVEAHGFRSAILPTSAGGRPLDDDVFEPLLAVLEELRLLVLLHPAFVAPDPRLQPYRLTTLVAFPFETTLAVARLIFSGSLDRHPGLRLVLAHGGGDLPYLRGRLNTLYHATGWEADPSARAHIRKPPGDYLDGLYFDSATASAESLRFLIDLVGPQRVLFGSDYPFEIGDPTGAHALPAIRDMPPADQEAILGGNALALLDAARRGRSGGV